MKVLSVNNVNFCKQNLKNHYSLSNSGNVAFKSYKVAANNALYKDYLTKNDISSVFTNLFSELVSAQGIKKGEYFEAVAPWLSKMPIAFLNEICKPVAEVKSGLRDIIFASEKTSLKILERTDTDALYIANLGKQGFLNSLFNNQEARNDMRIIYTTNRGSLNLGMKKDKTLVLEQSHDGYASYNYFSPNSNERDNIKSVDSNEPFILPN